MTPQPTLPEVTLLEGARLFVAAHPLREAHLSEIRRYHFYALMWLSGGSATFVCDTERFEVAASSLICTAPGQVHQWEAPEAQAHVTLLGFVPEIFTGGSLDVRLITDLPLFQPDSTTILPALATGATLATLFAQVWQRYLQLSDAEPSREWRVLPRQQEALLLAYLHVILAEAATLDIAPPTLRPLQQADLRLARLFRMSAASGALQRYPVAHYAELLHVTPDHLTRVVRRVTGKVPSAWLQERLLLEAKRLLLLTELPVERIAEELQFPSATQFSQWFRTHAGQSPRQARQQERHVSSN
ncbi:helix-turn-helix domain-containing protein [Deinococcus sp.]|uniref:helix-turn-helix domain-containing protein n=1 Tax=Deinococcus sp. TaxID=47478 RepID=UPI003B5A0D3A